MCFRGRQLFLVLLLIDFAENWPFANLDTGLSQICFGLGQVGRPLGGIASVFCCLLVGLVCKIVKLSRRIASCFSLCLLTRGTITLRE
jgi:hypothetical protein